MSTNGGSPADSFEDAKVEYAFRRTPSGDDDLLAREAASDRYDTSVRVLQLPMAFVVEFGLSPEGSADYNYKRYTTGEARALAEQLRFRTESDLHQKLGKLLASTTANGLENAADLASTKAVRGVMGDDVIDAYAEGNITAEEAAHEGGRNIDRQMGDQVR